MEGKSIPEHEVKEISQPPKIKDLYFNLLKSSKKEIMLLIPTNNAFKRQERLGIIGVVKQVASGKTPQCQSQSVSGLENLENGQELVQEPFPLKANYHKILVAVSIYDILRSKSARPARNYLNSG